MKAYFKLGWDPDFPRPWCLGEVACEASPIDCRIFTYGKSVAPPGALTVPITKHGVMLKLSFAAFDVPVVSREVGEIIGTFAADAVERFPVKVGDIVDRYEVLNVTCRHDAVDRERSRYLLWGPEDGRPDKLGTFRQLYPMVFRRDIQPPHIFRVKEWEAALIVSAELMEALGGAGLEGAKFKPVQQ